MESMNFERLGKAVAHVSEHQPGADDVIGEARQRLVEAPESSSKRPLRALLLAAVVLMSGLLAIGGGLSRLSPNVIGFTTSGKQGREGDWVTAESRRKKLEFSEGSVVTLNPTTRVRVGDLSARGAELVLERGVAHAAFVPRDEAQWVMRAGPFSVEVTGTQFELQWAPESKQFALLMAEGSVLVDGPLLNGQRQVVAGEQLRIALEDGQLRLTSEDGSSDRPLRDAEQPATNGKVAGAVEANRASESSVRSSPATPDEEEDDLGAEKPAFDGTGNRNTEDDWRSSLKAGDPKRAFRQLAHQPEAQLRDGSTNELLQLADAARLAGRAALAQQALLVARKERGVTGNTAYLLGKVSADQLGQTQQAATWFETYLQEQPEGDLHQQALGRLLEIRRTRQPAVARKLAKRYLDRYPSGAYAELARSLVEP